MPMNPQAKYFAGVDVQVSRGLAWCVLDQNAATCASGWVDVSDFQQSARDLRRQFENMTRDVSEISIGIDGPRMPLPHPRQFYWQKTQSWRPKRPSDKGFGRHCEVIIKALNIGNIQWTPVAGAAPQWMELGFALFNELHDFPFVHEVFPTAAYKLLAGDVNTTMSLNLADFARGPKDMLDAHAAALTVYEYDHGRGWDVGGGDGFGSIVLPRKIDTTTKVLQWPGL